uniref:Coiled-coil domain-containing protein n=1 Tax=Anopheles quadriannulatus TaxID=34691 RepID=A0A182X6H6_ANOQN
MDGAGATSLELHSESALKMDASFEEIIGQKAIQVSTEWDSEDSDTADDANDASEYEDVDYESKLSNVFSNMSLATSQSKLSMYSTESNEASDETHGQDAERTLVQSDTEEEEDPDERYDEGNGSGSTSDSSDTLDAGSEEEQEEEDHEKQPIFTDRGGGDADLNLDSDPSSQIIKVNIAHKKRVSDPEAYKNWLKAKNEEIRKNREKELLAKQELQRQKEQEEEKRKEESKKKIKEWMQRKKQDSTKKATNPKAAKERQHSQSSSSEHLYCDPDAKFKSWLLNVRKREEEKRLRAQTVKQLEKKIQDEKKKISDEIYQEWLKSAKHKPKPVPLNQGPHTLRGTVSQIFINPQPWKSNVEE